MASGYTPVYTAQTAGCVLTGIYNEATVNFYRAATGLFTVAQFFNSKTYPHKVPL
jgi:hypothetical protein